MKRTLAVVGATIVGLFGVLQYRAPMPAVAGQNGQGPDTTPTMTPTDATTGDMNAALNAGAAGNTMADPNAAGGNATGDANANANANQAGAATNPPGAGAAGAGTGQPPATTGATPAPTPPTTAAGPPRSFTGPVILTMFGAVQARVFVSGNRIVDVQATTAALEAGAKGNAMSQDIDNRALPILRTEVLQAQSANIATVSGATYTSNGYKQSLQKALNAAGLGATN